MKNDAIIIGEHTIAMLRAGQTVEVRGVALIPADDLMNAAPRPEAVPTWNLLDDHTSTPSCTSVLAGERKQPFTHWFTTMYKGDFYYYKVEVPKFDEPLPQKSEGT